MPKVKISEYSATANSNTDVASINIDEGCAPSGINNAIRAVMGHLKDFQQGTNGDPFNGPVNGTVGATTRNTGAFTTLTSNGATTFTAGTASTTTGTGTLVITGGLGVSGRINAANVDGIIGANTAAAGSFTTLNANGGSANPLPSNFSILATSGVAKLYSYWSDNSARGSFEFHVAGGNGSLDLTAFTITDGASAKVKNVISVGDATPSTSGAGITFPATQSASSNANTLDDYEEGTWTPTDLSGASLSFTTTLGRYTKVGNQVTAWAWIQYPVTASGLDNTIGGLPFNIANETALRGGFALGFSQTASVGGGILSPNTAYFVLVTSAGLNVTNATLSTVIVSFVVIYHVA